MIRYEADISYNDDLKAHLTARTFFGALKLQMNFEENIEGGLYLFGYKIRSIDQIIAGIEERNSEVDEHPAPKLSHYDRLKRAFKNKGAHFKNTITEIFNIKDKKLREYILTALKAFMKQLLPREMAGNIRFGLDDPYYTGKVLELFVLLYAKMGDDLKVTPVWDELCFSGNLEASGKIHLSVILWNMTKLIVKSDFRRFWRLHNGK